MSDNITSSPFPETPPPKRKFSPTFWILNTIEMWERLAFFNLRVMAPIYIMQADNPGGLHLTAADKGVIYAWWSVFQSLLPIVTGGLADRFGYKRSLALAISTMMTRLYAHRHVARFDVPDSRFRLPDCDHRQRSTTGRSSSPSWCLPAEPRFSSRASKASLAHQLTKENSSVGWGIFYWVVNVGAYVGHFLPGVLLGLSALLPEPFHGAANSKEAWRNLFLASAFFTSFNLLLLLTFRDVPSGASKTESIFDVL